MSEDRSETIERLLQEALDLPLKERAAYLASACGEDSALRREVEALIAASEEAGEFLESPALEREADSDGGEEADLEGVAIGSYQILREIGRGGMGEVYLAVRADHEYKKRVAIKVVKRGMDTEFILKRFRQERQILAGLDHPNIARLTDGGTTEDGRPYFVMDYVEGEPITRYSDARSLSIWERLKLFQVVCSAVQFAHQNLVIHRDIKPSNVLVTAEGVPKLIDFGVAKLVNPELSSETIDLTAELGRMVTPEYASPEQIRGERITTASDVYSLGVLLYELLTGHRPHRFPTRSPAEVVRVVSEVEPEKPSTAAVRAFDPRAEGASSHQPATSEAVARARETEPLKLRKLLSGDLDTIVLRALHKEPQRRYASVERLSDDVERYLKGQPVAARKDTVGYRTRKFLARHKAGVAAAGLVAASLVGGIVMTARQTRIAQTERAKAEQRLKDIRKLTNSLLFEFHDSIATLAGATPARELLVRRALEYLAALSREGGDDPQLQRDLAEAYQKLGDVQGKLSDASLGQTAGALGSYRKALVIREALAARFPQSVEDGDALARNLIVVSAALETTGENAPSLTLARRAVEVQERLLAGRPADLTRMTALGSADHRLATALSVNNDHHASLEVFQKEAALFEAVSARDPKDARARRSVALSYKYIGGQLEAMAAYRAALESFRKALPIEEALSAADPANALYRRDLTFTLGEIGATQSQLGEVAAAVESYRKVIAVREELAVADPKNTNMRLLVASAETNLGETLRKSGDREGGLEHLRKAEAMLRASVSADPENVYPRQLLGNAYQWLGAANEPKTQRATGRPASGEGSWREARAFYQRSLDIWLDLSSRGKLAAAYAKRPAELGAAIAKCDEALRR